MDEQLTIHELSRLEAQRKLGVLPKAVLETAWVRDAQVEAVIDAVLVIALGDDVAAYSHARHVGEWCARIAAALPNGPDAGAARRCGVLSDIDPLAIKRIPEIASFAPHVRCFQQLCMSDLSDEAEDDATQLALVLRVASEFEGRLSAENDDRPVSVTSVLMLMLRNATARARLCVEALHRTFRQPLRLIA